MGGQCTPRLGSLVIAHSSIATSPSGLKAFQAVGMKCAETNKSHTGGVAVSLQVKMAGRFWLVHHPLQ